MRTILRWSALILGFGVVTLALRAGEDAKKVIERAIAAHGGADKIDKYKAMKTVYESSIFLGGMELGGTNETTVVYPDRLKTVAKVTVMGIASTVVEIVTPTRHVMTVDGMNFPVPEVTKLAVRQSLDMFNMTRLTPLAKGEGFSIKSLGKRKIEDEEFDVVEASGKALKNAQLYFSSSSSLLARFQWQGQSPKEQNKIVEQTVVFGKYKETSGIQLPLRKVHLVEGERFSIETITDLKLLEKVEGEFGN